MSARGIVWSSGLSHDDERLRERRRRRRRLYLVLAHIALACVPAALFCTLLLYFLWSKP